MTLNPLRSALRVASPADKGGSRAAYVRFDSAWNETFRGNLVPGGSFTLEYPVERLQQWATVASHNGYPTWGAEAYVKFNPSGKVEAKPIMQLVGVNGNMAGARPVAMPATFLVPEGTTGVEVWFKTTAHGQGGPRVAFDSNDSQNYVFKVAGK